MRGRYILLMLALALICAACSSGSSQRTWWPQTVTVGPKIVSMVVPEEPWFGVTGWRFSAVTSGSPVISWEWDFGGGASPNESTESAPYVYLVNESFTRDETYTCTLTVRDAQGNSDTASSIFYVSRQEGVLAGFINLPASIYGNFSFSIYDEGDGPVEITLEITQGEGVTIEPSYIYATRENYGPFNISVINHNVEDVAVTICITLDNEDDALFVDSVSGTIPGLQLPVNSIVAVSDAQVVRNGDLFTMTVYAGNLDYSAGSFDSIRMVLGNGLEMVGGSVNLGSVGNASNFSDGLFRNVHGYVAIVDTTWPPDSGNFSCSITTVGEGSPPGASGALFNVQLRAVSLGNWNIDFVPEYTHYIDPEGAQHDFTNIMNSSVRVIPAE